MVRFHPAEPLKIQNNLILKTISLILFIFLLTSCIPSVKESLMGNPKIKSVKVCRVFYKNDENIHSIYFYIETIRTDNILITVNKLHKDGEGAALTLFPDKKGIVNGLIDIENTKTDYMLGLQLTNNKKMSSDKYFHINYVLNFNDIQCKETFNHK